MTLFEGGGGGRTLFEGEAKGRIGLRFRLDIGLVLGIGIPNLNRPNLNPSYP